jgi:2-methylcitrate dehydratase
MANAHPPGTRPFGRDEYIHTFRTMTDGIITTRESNRFLEAAQGLPRLPAGELHRLNIALPDGPLAAGPPGIL